MARPRAPGDGRGNFLVGHKNMTTYRKQHRTEQQDLLSKILALLIKYEDVYNIAQRPYKDDFFHIFYIAYTKGFCGHRIEGNENDIAVWVRTNKPLIVGDVIKDFAREKAWIIPNHPEHEKRESDIDLVRHWWDEWEYAWDRNPPKRSYSRNRSK